MREAGKSFLQSVLNDVAYEWLQGDGRFEASGGLDAFEGIGQSSTGAKVGCRLGTVAQWATGVMSETEREGAQGELCLVSGYYPG